MLYAIIAVLVILADQLIKIYVTTDGFQPIQLIPGVLDLGINGGDPNALHYVQNNGGAFGLLGGQIPTFWFIVIAGVFTVLVILALSTKFIRGFLARWSIVLVTAGGISNCIDRVINVKPDGHVVDMFLFPFTQRADGTYWFPVFNLADVFITVFCILFILAILFGRSPKSSADEDEFDEDEEEEEDLVEEEEKVRPSRRSRKSRKDEYEEEEDEEEEVRRPAAKVERKSRKARQSKYDEEYEQYKAAQRAREAAQQPQPAAVVENPEYNPADPFAEWERANNAQPAQRPAPAPVEVQDEPTQAAFTAPRQQRPAAARSELAADPQYASRPAAQPKQEQPAPAPAPAPRPARKPAPAPVEEPESFSLDDILAEFK